MSMTKLTAANLLAVSALVLAPAAMTAQTAPTIDATLSLSTTSLQVDGADYRLNALNLVADINISDKFTLGLDLDQGRQTYMSDTAIKMNRVEIAPEWAFDNGAYVGVYGQTATTTVSIISVTVDNIGVFAGYDQDRWSIAAYAGESATDFGNTAEFRGSNAGLTLVGRPTEQLELFGHYASARMANDIGAQDRDITVSALGAQYSYGNGMMAYVAGGTFDAGLFDQKLSQLAIGGGADLAQFSANLPGMLTFEIAQTDDNAGFEQNQLTLGWVVGLGNGTPIPLNGIARVARGGIKGPLIAGTGVFGAGSVFNQN
jgi:hypothetical protein